MRSSHRRMIPTTMMIALASQLDDHYNAERFAQEQHPAPPGPKPMTAADAECLKRAEAKRERRREKRRKQS